MTVMKKLFVSAKPTNRPSGLDERADVDVDVDADIMVKSR